MRVADAGLSMKSVMACLIGLAIIHDSHDSLLDFHQTRWCCSSCRWRRLPSHNLGITSGLTQLARTWHKGGETRQARMLHAGDKTSARLAGSEPLKGDCPHLIGLKRARSISELALLAATLRRFTYRHMLTA